MKSTVTSVSYKKEWEGRSGPMHDHNIEFENGDKGVYSCQDKDQTVFVEGQESEYTTEQVQDGKYPDKIKPPRPTFGGGNGRPFGPKHEDDRKSMHACNSMNNAVAMYCSGQLERDEVIEQADKIFTWLEGRWKK